jgi:hypothetical protein
MTMIQQRGGGGLGWVPNIVDLSIARMQQHQQPATALHGSAAAAYNLGLQYYHQHQHNMAAYYQSSRFIHHDNPVVLNAACSSPPNHGITEAARLKAPVDGDNVVPKMAMYKSSTKTEQVRAIKKA